MLLHDLSELKKILSQKNDCQLNKASVMTKDFNILNKTCFEQVV
jgi:hypothetical protein